MSARRSSLSALRVSYELDARASAATLESAAPTVTPTCDAVLSYGCHAARLADGDTCVVRAAKATLIDSDGAVVPVEVSVTPVPAPPAPASVAQYMWPRVADVPSPVAACGADATVLVSTWCNCSRVPGGGDGSAAAVSVLEVRMDGGEWVGADVAASRGLASVVVQEPSAGGEGLDVATLELRTVSDTGAATSTIVTHAWQCAADPAHVQWVGSRADAVCAPDGLLRVVQQPPATTNDPTATFRFDTTLQPAQLR